MYLFGFNFIHANNISISLVNKIGIQGSCDTLTLKVSSNNECFLQRENLNSPMGITKFLMLSLFLSILSKLSCYLYAIQLLLTFTKFSPRERKKFILICKSNISHSILDGISPSLSESFHTILVL
jgi:hypothetical protein